MVVSAVSLRLCKPALLRAVAGAVHRAVQGARDGGKRCRRGGATAGRQKESLGAVAAGRKGVVCGRVFGVVETSLVAWRKRRSEIVARFS